MSKSASFKRWIAMLLCLIVALGMVIPATATRGTYSPNGSASSDRVLDAIQKEHLGTGLDPDEVIRVSIVLEKKSTLEAGYSTLGIANNKNAMNYRDSLRAEQATVQTAIERRLNKDLDVVWNLTLAANIISANVRRGDIAAIKGVNGVESVYVEKQYSPDVVSVGGTADPDMAIAGMLGGAQDTWLSGYTGEGALIAIIDTGLDINHQSFDNGAFLAAVNKANLKLDEETVKGLAAELNAVKSERATADQLYRNEKVPFGWNYIDSSAEITHDNDSAGEHGSHVAGIAAANRLVDTDGDGEYEDALEAVQVAGNAPDAQIMIMKVFGKAGGAYDSDCAAAIEDAILLGADAVNLSLGTPLPGFAAPQDDDPYAAIQDLLVNSDTVVVFSAGNAGSWAENTALGYLYNDGVSYQFDGESGSYTNSFTVASVDNGGFIGATFTVDGNEYGFNETSGYGNPAFGKTLDPDGKGATYKFVMVEFAAAGHDAEIVDLLPIDDDTIYITWRGGTSFFEKGNAGYSAGAAAVIVGNNTDGAINMDLTGYEGDIPVVSILQVYADEIWASVADKQTAGDYQYITGTLTVNGATKAHANTDGYYTMSSFSSWGTTGDLALKPEISAFGGSILSVWGSNASSDAPTTAHNQYELMSGTSMAAPQITGMSALVQQYLREQDYDLGDATSRAITMGLLMATAEPMKDAYGDYYSLLQQGAGLANVLNAVSSPVYITVKGQNDGKVKAELGDDIGRDGKYVVEFDIHNFTDDAYSYEISADVFTQAYFAEDGYGEFLDYATRPMDADVSVKIDGSHVTVTIQLTAEEIETLEEENPDGAFVEAYVFVQPVAESDGALAPELSIPVLAYYGNWTDASMFEVGSAEDWYNRTNNGKVGGRYPYTYGGAYSSAYELTMTNVLYTGTPVASVSKNSVLLNGADAGLDMGTMNYRFTAIRNYGNGVVQVTDNNGKVLWRSNDFGASYGVTYYENAGFWLRPEITGSLYYNLYKDVTIDWAAALKNVDSTVSEITISLILAPEYYAQYDYDWDALTDKDPSNGELGHGAILSTTLSLDQEAPVIASITVDGDDPATRTITVELTDNKDLARAVLYNEGDASFIATKTFSGSSDTSVAAVFSGADKPLNDGIYRIEVTDASGNVTVERFEVGSVKFTDVPETVTPSETSIEIVNGSVYALSAEVGPYNLTDEAKAVTWSSADESIATVDENGVVTAVGKGTTTVTVSTVANGANGSPVTAEITVEVFTLPITATGILGDADGYAKFFEWDFEAGNLVYSDAKESEVVYPQAVTTYDEGTFLAVDGDGTMYEIDAEGNILQSSVPGAYDGYLPYDMDYTDDAGFWWTMWGYLLNEPDPFAPEMYGFNLASYGEYIGLVVDDDYSFDTVYQGSLVHIERTIYLLNTDNEIVEIYLYNDGQNALIAINETDLTATWVGYGGESYSNMVLGADGNLYASIMTGDTNEVYQLTYWETDTDWGYTSLYLGNFGDGVWPGLFLTVENKPSDVKFDFNNDWKVDEADAQVLLRAVVRETTTEDMDVNGDGKVTTRDVFDLLMLIQAGEVNAVKAPAAAKMASIAAAAKAETTGLKPSNVVYSVDSGDAEVDSSVHTVVVPITASDVNNGLFALNYDADVLTYKSNTTTDSTLTHVYAKDDVVRIGFAGLTTLADDTVVAEIAFTYEKEADDRVTEFTISVIEEDDTYNETPETETVEATLPGEAEHSYNLTGVLTDESFNAHYFTWNTDEAVDYTYTIDGYPMNPVTAASISDTEYYMINYDLIYDKYDMYLMSKETGEVLDVLEGWGEAGADVIPWDMAYGGDDFYGMWGVYAYYIFTDLGTDEPMANQSLAAWNFYSYGMPYFLGIDVVEEAWTSTDSNGSHSGDKYILAIDDSGLVWKLMPYDMNGGISATIEQYDYVGLPDLWGVGFATNDAPGSSMVVGDDGALYFSFIDEDAEATAIYRLEYDGKQYVGEQIAETDYWVYPALLLDVSVNHVWGEPEFTWSEDLTSATATFTCRADCDESVTVDATITSEVTTEPTCEENGVTTYTATVEFNGKTYTDTMEVDDVPALGHVYGEAKVTPATCVDAGMVEIICAVCGEVFDTVEIPATGEHVYGETTVTDPTCEEDGSIVITCAVCEEVIDTITIDAYGHIWGEPEFTWSEDGKSATATFTCEHDETHTVTVEATVTSEVKVEATATEDGTTTYTATVEFEGETYTATKDVQDIPATGTTDEPGTSDDPSTSDDPNTSDEPGTSDEPSTSDDPSIPDDPNSPETGDNNHVVFWASLILLSLFGVYAIVALPRKVFDEGR